MKHFHGAHKGPGAVLRILHILTHLIIMKNLLSRLNFHIYFCKCRNQGTEWLWDLLKLHS